MDEKPWLEVGLPEAIMESIRGVQEGERNNSTLLDCLYDDLYGSINTFYWGGDITEEQAVYLRRKYLYTEDEGDA